MWEYIVLRFTDEDKKIVEEVKDSEGAKLHMSIADQVQQTMLELWNVWKVKSLEYGTETVFTGGVRMRFADVWRKIVRLREQVWKRSECDVEVLESFLDLALSAILAAMHIKLIIEQEKAKSQGQDSQDQDSIRVILEQFPDLKEIW